VATELPSSISIARPRDRERTPITPIEGIVKRSRDSMSRGEFCEKEEEGRILRRGSGSKRVRILLSRSISLLDLSLYPISLSISSISSISRSQPKNKYIKIEIKILAFPPPDLLGFRANIQACCLLAEQGGAIFAARFPAWRIARRIITLDAPASAREPMVTPFSR